jgi:hypothetical protein
MSQIIPIYIPTYISAADYAPARVQPRLLYYNGQVDCERFYVKDQSNAGNEVKQFPYFDNYSVVSGSFPTTGSKSLLFFNEAPVYGTQPVNSLYSEYWSDYVNLLYNPRTRLLNMSAIIPLADYFNMELNDIVEFRGNNYHLRAINDYNLSTGECNIQLLGPILEGTFGSNPPPVPPTTTTTTTTTTAAPTTTTTTTASPTTTTTTTTLPPGIYSFTGCGYGGSVSAACNDASNNRTLYSDCTTGTFGVGCFVYVDTFPNPLTGYTNVFMNGGCWDINSSTGVVTAFSSVQC